MDNQVFLMIKEFIHDVKIYVFLHIKKNSANGLESLIFLLINYILSGIII